MHGKKPHHQPIPAFGCGEPDWPTMLPSASGNLQALACSHKFCSEFPTCLGAVSKGCLPVCPYEVCAAALICRGSTFKGMPGCSTAGLLCSGVLNKHLSSHSCHFIHASYDTCAGARVWSPELMVRRPCVVPDCCMRHPQTRMVRAGRLCSRTADAASLSMVQVQGSFVASQQLYWAWACTRSWTAFSRVQCPKPNARSL